MPIAVLLVISISAHKRGRFVCGTLLLLYLGSILTLSLNNRFAYLMGWSGLGFAIPVITIGAVVQFLVPQFSRPLSCLRKQQIMLLISATALVSIVQFPFSVPIYFCYVAPLAILALTAMFGSLVRPPHFMLGILIVFYLVFAVFLVTPSMNSGLVTGRVLLKTQRLVTARAGGLRVDPVQAQTYNELIPVIQMHAVGKFIYAAPDCPEVYFLAGMRNPTRTLFDFRDEPVGRNERILRAIESHGVNVVVIDGEPPFSSRLDPTLVAALGQLYPNSQEIGHFQVRWKGN